MLSAIPDMGKMGYHEKRALGKEYCEQSGK